MNLNKVKNNFERLFDKNLTDLVRGIRHNKNNEAKFITQCIEEIKGELRIPNVNAKANAVAKLTYIQMLGYDISWAAFNIIEVMSSERFTHKRIGYLAASQCFSMDTEVLMLTINMIRRDLCSRNMYETGCAMSGMSCFVSNEIGRELFNDVNRLFSSTKPYLRKKAVLLMYKILIEFPDTISEVLPKLEEKLEDPDQGVQSSVINVICELARKNPSDFLNLEGILYKLMENSSNNWMLIKIIKLFGALTPLEPRMGEKIIVPLENLAHDTSAMSVLYETISTMMAILASPTCKIPKARASAYRQLCVQKLRIFIEDSDQNLKYLGLLAMKKMLHIHPKSVRAHQDIILTCLEDKDESIRLRALDLLYGMVSKDNLTTQAGDGIVDRLMKHVSYPKMGNKFRDEIVSKVIDICSRNDYFYISNFDWYITVLVTLASIEGGTSHGNMIASQVLDVALRVKEVRPYAVKQMAAILNHTDKFSTTFSVSEVLYAAAWICGEYSDTLTDKTETMYNLLRATGFESYIIAIFVQNACKIFSRIAHELIEQVDNKSQESEAGEEQQDQSQAIAEESKTTTKTKSNIDVDDANNNSKNKQQEKQQLNNEKLNAICDRLVEKELAELKNFDDLEVQQRVSNFLAIINATRMDHIDFSTIFYAYALNPVTSHAQSKVPIPEGLDLDVSLEYDPESPLSTDNEESDDDHDDDSSRHRFESNELNQQMARASIQSDEDHGLNPMEAHFSQMSELKSTKNDKQNSSTSNSNSRRYHDIHYLTSSNNDSQSRRNSATTGSKTRADGYGDIGDSTYNTSSDLGILIDSQNSILFDETSGPINTYDNSQQTLSRVEEGLEAIKVAQKNVKDFRGIPGLTSYSDFIKKEKPVKASRATKTSPTTMTTTTAKKKKKKPIETPTSASVTDATNNDSQTTSSTTTTLPKKKKTVIKKKSATNSSKTTTTTTKPAKMS